MMEGIGILEKGDYWGYNQHCVEAKSDARDAGQVFRYLRGPMTGLIVVSALFLLVVMLQGALISINTGNQLLASQVSLISTFLPAFLLSGFIYAIDNMPTALQYITLIVPARYFVALSRVIFLKGLSPLVLWTEVAALTVMLLLLMRVTLLRSRKLGLLP